MSRAALPGRWANTLLSARGLQKSLRYCRVFLCLNVFPSVAAAGAFLLS